MTQQAAFLKKLTLLAKELGCYGQLRYKKHLPKAPKSLTLDQIARLQVMMDDEERLVLTLELGADPNAIINGISSYELSKSLHFKRVSKLLEKYREEPTKPSKRPRSKK